MLRREFISLLGGAAVWPLAARAQQRGPMRLIGVLIGFPTNDPASQGEIATLRAALATLGWVEGRDLRLEVRAGSGDADTVHASAKALVDLNPDVIVGQSTAVTAALARETRTIPIVFVNIADPVASGFAVNLARPGGNFTGFTVDNSAQGGKWVELLKEIAPGTVRAALLFNPATAAPVKLYMPSIEAAGSASGIHVSAAAVHSKDEIEAVIATQARERGSGLIVLPDTFNTTNRDAIIAQAARHRVPAVYFNHFFPDSGGLVSYGPDFTEQFREAANYVHQILRGAKPGELPVQAPTKFELVVNLKTAKALALPIPARLLTRADRVIE
jgi:putative tryptophan/tyrosine transport system substrate-binding protein